MNFIYETDRLFLRILNEDSCEEVTQFLYNNRDFFEPFEPKHPDDYYTMEFQEKVLRGEFAGFMKQKLIRYYLFPKESPEEVIGSVSITEIQRPPFSSCQIGYKLGENWIGRGYATEALKQLMNIATGELKLHRIEAFVMPSNLRSIKFIEKNGFKRDALLKERIEIQGEWQDHYLYSFTCRALQKQNEM